MPEPSPLRAFWSAFRENRGAVAGLAVVVLIVLLAIFADVVEIGRASCRERV